MTLTPENFSNGELSSPFFGIALATSLVCHGIRPQADQDHFRPFVHRVEHEGPGLFLQVPDASLRYAILKMGINPAV